jgi:hypothetical protein
MANYHPHMADPMTSYGEGSDPTWPMMATRRGLRGDPKRAKRAIGDRQTRDSGLPGAIVWGKEGGRADRPARLLCSPWKAAFLMEGSSLVGEEKPSPMAREVMRSTG